MFKSNKEKKQKQKETEEILDEKEEAQKEETQGDEELDSNLDANKEGMEEQNKEDEFKKILGEKEAEKNDYLIRLQRLQADFTNYKKRVEKEKSDIFLYANEKMALDLLSVLDNFERALEAPDDEKKENDFYKGLTLILKQMKDTLKKHEIEEIDALHKPFDMNLHHAVMREEAECEENQVIEVLQKGYTIHGKILRAAMVKVSM